MIFLVPVVLAVGAFIYNTVMRNTYGPEITPSDWLPATPAGRVALVASLIGIVLGMFVESISMILMTLPVTYPVVIALGFDPIWFGIFIVFVVEMAQITPPVGLNLSVLTALTNNEVTLGRAAYATVPYWLIHLCAIGIITMFPVLVLFLPNLFF